MLWIFFVYLGFTIEKIEKAISNGSLGCNIFAGFIVTLSIIFALNFAFGIGKSRGKYLLYIMKCTYIFLYLQFAHQIKMDLVVASVKRGFLENHMNGMDLCLLVRSVLLWIANVKKIIMVHIVMIASKVSMDSTVLMVLSLYILVFTIFYVKLAVVHNLKASFCRVPRIVRPWIYVEKITITFAL